MNAEALDALFARYPTPIGRDLRLTMARALLDGAIAPASAAPVWLALGELTGDRAIADLAAGWMRDLGFAEAMIAEAREAAGLMTMLNTYYGFRGELADPGAYGAAGLRMASSGRPALGKPTFERIALAVSVANKCGPCIRAHEAWLLEHGAARAEIHDLARLAAAVAGASKLP